MSKIVWLCCLLGVAALCLPSQVAATPSADRTTEGPPIRSQEELDRYLLTVSPGQSPLDRLSPGARERFLASLLFGASGVRGFDPTDLMEQLNGAGLRDVLDLFGLEKMAASLPGKGSGKPPARRAPSAFERDFNTFYLARVNAPTPQQIRVNAGPLYEQLLEPAQHAARLSDLDTYDLKLLYRGTHTMASVSPDARFLEYMRKDIDEFARRGLAIDSPVNELRDLLVSARRFDTARALADTYPQASLSPLPHFRGAGSLPPGQPTAILVNTNGLDMQRKAVDMDAPWRIVIVAGCHFSADAAREISADPELNSIFKEHGIWLASERESLDAVREWNRVYVDQPMHVAWDDSEWTRLDSWAMPTFYVFRSGELIEKWSGWPKDSGMLTLRDKLHEAGILQ